MQKNVIYCGVFNCSREDCEHHIKSGDNFDMPNKFNNLMHSEVCVLDRDCEHCKFKVDGDCQVWECKFEPKEEKKDGV